jgi:hypothetical protein
VGKPFDKLRVNGLLSVRADPVEVQRKPFGPSLSKPKGNRSG